MREHLQASVDAEYDRFKGHVTAFRNVGDDDMQGQSFDGAEARERGLVDDATYPNLEAVVTALNNRSK
jgi:ClpP class serine protease